MSLDIKYLVSHVILGLMRNDFAKGGSKRAMAWHKHRKVVKRKKRQYFQMQERKKKILLKFKPKLA